MFLRTWNMVFHFVYRKTWAQGIYADASISKKDPSKYNFIKSRMENCVGFVEDTKKEEDLVITAEVWVVIARTTLPH